MLESIKNLKGKTSMAIIKQKGLFDWRDIEELGDLERLQIIMENFPDEELILVP